MELTTEQQIFEQIKKSQKVLILLPESLTEDALASGLALRLFLLKQQKDVNLISSGQPPEALKFLPGAESLQSAIAAGKSLVVTLDTAIKKLDEISYQTGSDQVHIYLKSKGQDFTSEDISFSKEKFPVDLIILLDCKSLEDLGKIYEQHTDLLYETPKVNIDNKSDNEYFGAVNFVDVTASSVAEMLAELFQKYEDQLIDEDVATCLLAGIIAKTHSFQHVQTTPKAFFKASELVALGGRQQEVVKNIFKTKSLQLLKLWGRALARMKILEPPKVLYSVLGFTDFEKAESGEAEILPMLKEFLDNISGYKIVGLITEPKKGLVSLTAAVHEQIPAEQFLQGLGLPGKVFNYNLGNHKVLQTEPMDSSPEDLENKFLEALKKI
jgi:nanoRNase/pAp phosphatase (c-di-AMP/oligoRNAs hydrolase)